MRIFTIVILLIYIYGAIAIKYAAGSVSFVEGVSQTIYGDKDEFTRRLEGIIDPYNIGLLVFFLIVMAFSLGNIENSWYLQLVTTVLWFLSIFLMIGTSFVSLFINGCSSPKEMTYFNFDYISILFGNSIFMFMCHHSISGIVYPIWPQNKIKPMFIYSFLLAAVLLLLEGILA